MQYSYWHCELYIAFAQASNDTRQYVWCKCCRLNPSVVMKLLKPNFHYDELTYINALAILPTIVISRIRLRPYLSESAPIWGETKNCSVLCAESQCGFGEETMKALTRIQSPWVHLWRFFNTLNNNATLMNLPKSTTSHFLECTSELYRNPLTFDTNWSVFGKIPLEFDISRYAKISITWHLYGTGD